jgi:hypothetical protein
MHGWFMQNSEVRNTHNTLAICRMANTPTRINPMRGSGPLKDVKTRRRLRVSQMKLALKWSEFVSKNASAVDGTK